MLLVTLVASRAIQAISCKVRVGAWNLENLGVTKMGKEWFMEGLAKVHSTYSAVCIDYKVMYTCNPTI